MFDNHYPMSSASSLKFLFCSEKGVLQNRPTKAEMSISATFPFHRNVKRVNAQLELVTHELDECLEPLKDQFMQAHPHVGYSGRQHSINIL